MQVFYIPAETLNSEVMNVNWKCRVNMPRSLIEGYRLEIGRSL